MYGLTSDLVKLLQEAAPIMDQWAQEICSGGKTKGGMEEWAKEQQSLAKIEDEFNCGWYHSTWQYLRLLNMVAVPNWYGFYNKALGEVLKNKPNANVFISACADFGMLNKLYEAVVATNAKPTITIYDICETPLKSSQWFADRVGLKVSCKTGNIITGDIPEAPFDLVVTDEFLTVLKDDYKPEITNKWKKILKPDGTLVTTAMMGKPTTLELREKFAKRAHQICSVYGEMMLPDYNSKKQMYAAKFEKFAEYHTRHMLQSEDVLNKIFKGYKSVWTEMIITPGECVNPTPSFQIVAVPGA